MKTWMKVFLIFCMLGALFALPGSALAQTPPPPAGPNLMGDQMVLGDSFNLQAGQTLTGDLLVVGGQANIDQGSKIIGDIALVGGVLHISGEVDGNVGTMGGTVDLTSSAVITGELSTVGSTVNRDDKAVISGGIHVGGSKDFNFGDFRYTPRIPVQTNDPGSGILNLFTRLIVGFMWVLLSSALAVIALLIMPLHAGRSAETLSAQPIVSGGIGLLTLILSPFVIVLLSITVILIPVALLAVLVLFIAILLGWITLGYEIGRRMEAGFHQNWAEPVVAGVGTFALSFIAYLFNFIPCIGWLVITLLMSLGLGAVILSRFGTQVSRPNRPTGAIVPVAPVPPAPPAPPVPPVPPVEVEPPAGDQSQEPPLP